MNYCLIRVHWTNEDQDTKNNVEYFSGIKYLGHILSILMLRWRHNGLDGVSNHQPHDCSLNRLFRRRSMSSSKLRVTGLYARNSPVTAVNSSHKWPVTRKMFPLDDVIISCWFLRNKQKLLEVRSCLHIWWTHKNQLSTQRVRAGGTMRVTSPFLHIVHHWCSYADDLLFGCTFLSVVNILSHFYQHGLNLIATWLNIPMSDEIMYPFPSFSRCAIEVWHWISNFNAQFMVDIINTFTCCD